MTDADPDLKADRALTRRGPPSPAAAHGAPGEAHGEARPGPTPEDELQAAEAAAMARLASMPGASLEYWASLDDESREQCYDQLATYYGGLLEEFRVSANQSVAQYLGFSRLGQRWRLWLIVLTGLLALLNVLATSWPDALDGKDVRGYISFAAAIYAVLLALGTNLESYSNFADKKLGARDSRELYLDAYREFEMLRLTHVYPFGYSPQGCFNFHLLYRQLVEKDVELRRKLKQLSETNERGAAGAKTR
jgi:hypothetical protein